MPEPAAPVAPAWSPAGGPPTPACAWCGAPLGVGDPAAPGRITCRRCGVATTSPWPTDEQLDAAYGRWYRPEGGRFGGVGDAVLRRTRASLARRIDRLAPAGPVLDVGAGDGTLVDALRARGRDAVGLERCADRPHLRDADIAELSGRWAAVVFWHSLEHLREPSAALAHASRLLTPGGLLVVALPNAGSRQAARFGDRWLALDLPRHLVHVPADALIARLDELGFAVARVSHLRGGQIAFGWLHGLVGALPTRPDLYAAIRSSDAREQAVSPPRRIATLLAAVALAPAALVAATAEVVAKRGGSVYVEARR